MKKIWLIILSIGVVGVIGLLLSLGIGWYVWQRMLTTDNVFCGGIIGIACPAGYECQTDSTISDDIGHCIPSSVDPVPYDKSYGTVCPLDLQFIETKDGPTVDCQCPDGYTMDRTIVGGSSGDSCYGPGTECPIFEVTCIIK